MHRFQVRPEDIAGNILTLRGQEARHLSKVLRLGQGEEVLAFDNSGLEYRARVEQVNQDEVVCAILAQYETGREPGLDVFLLQGLPKLDKMELIIQKTTELGVRSIIPVRTARAVMQLEGKKAQDRVERWRKIAAEAAKQCGRPKVPGIGQVVDLEEGLRALPQGTMVLAAFEAEETLGLAEALDAWPGVPIALVIGPEGGFDPREIACLKAQGARSVSLGPRILRTETAGMAALTMILYQLGDLGKAGAGSPRATGLCLHHSDF